MTDERQGTDELPDFDDETKYQHAAMLLPDDTWVRVTVAKGVSVYGILALVRYWTKVAENIITQHEQAKRADGIIRPDFRQH